MPAKDKNQTEPAKPNVGVGGWQNVEHTLSRAFPGPAGANALLRVAFDKQAYADLIAHAKGSLEAEICGALAGNVCQDSHGLFVFVAAIIPGLAANRGSTHVTFTQETWNQIHGSLEKNYPKLQMVGWYHSHPGFGVEFSEMDLFIQRNFFGGPTQIALVTDPLNGAVAVCVNAEKGPQYLERFWVEGREQLCQTPKKSAASEADAGPSVDSESLRAMEARLGQLIQVVDEQRASVSNLLTFCVIAVCVTAIACFGYVYYSQYKEHVEPPKLNQFVPIPVKIGDETVLLGVGIAEWRVPDKLNAALVELEREKQEAAEKEKQGASNNPSVNNPTNASKP